VGVDQGSNIFSPPDAPLNFCFKHEFPAPSKSSATLGKCTSADFTDTNGKQGVVTVTAPISSFKY
jgi:hypothetical protein